MAASEASLSQVGRELFASILATTSSPPDLEAVVRRCKASGQHFTDPDFLPCSTSLIKDWNTSKKASSWQSFVWRRPEEFMNRSDITLFKDIEPSDIKQGSIGDCYFLSALSTLAEHSQRISKLFASDQVSDFGVYGIYVNKNGAWTTVIVDDYIPCAGPAGGPVFSKSVKEDLWVLLLEKAWAKVHGSYEKIALGLVGDTLRDLTGAPCATFPTDDSQAWEKLVDANSKKYVIIGSSGSTKASQTLLEQMGLIGKHAYAILDAKSAVTPTGPVRLLQIRNPWGNREWTGDWSDSSELWTDELRRKLKVSKADDGTFWISFEDFVKYFSFITICLINDEFVDSWMVRSVPAGQRSLISMIVEKRSQLFLSLNQIDKCTHPNPNYSYSDAKFVVGRKLQTGGFEFVIGKKSEGAGERNVWEGAVFPPGEYVISVDISWKEAGMNEFSFSSYGETAPNFAPLDDEIPDFLERIYADVAVRASTKADYSAQGVPEAVKFSGVRAEGYGFFHYQNSSDKVLKETVTFKKFAGLELLPPLSGKRFEVTVQPRENFTVVLKQTDHKEYAMTHTAIASFIGVVIDYESLARSQGFKAKRKDPVSKQELEINVFTCQHANGVCYLYENKTANRRLEETITFRITGLQIVGGGTDTVKVELGPGQSRLVELRAVERNWTIQTKVAYMIT